MRLLSLSTLTLIACSFGLGACTGPHSERASRAEARRDVEPQMEVVALRFASAVDVARLLGGALADTSMRIHADPRTNSVIVVGAPRDMERTRELIAKLDIEVK